MRKKIKIQVLFDAHMVGRNEGGNGRYAKNMVEALGKNSLVRIWGLSSVKNLGSNYIYKWWADRNFIRLGVGLGILAKKTGVNIIHGTYHVPILFKVKKVVTIHDLLFMRKPEYFSVKELMALRVFLPLTVRISDAIIVPSEFTKNELFKYFPNVNENIVFVVEEYADKSFKRILKSGAEKSIEKKLGIDKPFILTFNSKNKKKNIGVVLETFERARRKNSNFNLVVVGGGWNVDDKERWVEKGVRFLTNIEDKDLNDLYNTCKAVVYFSEYEGFGLPLVESLACGAEIIASDILVHREVGRDLVHYVALDDKVGLAKLMGRAIGGKLKKKNTHQVVGAWSDSAKKTIDVYKYVLKNK